MGHYIIKVRDHYAEWTTVMDAPASYFMSREEFVAFYREQYGARGLAGLDERLKRADETGCSALDGTTLKSLLSFNRAGPNETLLKGEEALWRHFGTEARDEIAQLNAAYKAPPTAHPQADGRGEGERS